MPSSNCSLTHSFIYLFIYFLQLFRRRTSRDMREEVAHGDVIYLNGNTYKVDVTPERPISPRYIPVEPVYLGATTRNARIVCGAADRNDENNDSLRSVFLAEIVARTMKQLIRMELRIYAKKTRCISYQVKSSLICEYLNVLTGSGAHASGRLQEQVYEGARQRFGAVAVRPSDRENMQNLLKPCIIYAVKRVMAMMGVNLSLNCLSEFTERPYTFTFTPLDLLDIRPVVRHNFPLLPFSDAAIATVQADIAASSTYLQAVVDDKPTLFLRLSERKGSRTGDNKGSIGSDFICYFSTGCVLEQPGPITTDPFTRSVLFHPGAKSIVDTKFHTLIVPQVQHRLYYSFLPSPSFLHTYALSYCYCCVVDRIGPLHSRGMVPVQRRRRHSASRPHERPLRHSSQQGQLLDLHPH